MLRYTGHAFIDIGIAAITAFVQKQRPEEVTIADLETVTLYIKQNYIRPPLRNYLTMAFTANAWFAQNAYNPEKPALSENERAQRRAVREEWAKRHLDQWHADGREHLAGTDELNCVFTGRIACSAELSGKLPPGRAGRAQVPLLQGDDAINFFANGQPGLPISGIALLALQFFPLGCARCGVGLLAIYSDNERLTYRLTREILTQNLADIVQAQAANEERLPFSPSMTRTLLVETLVRVEQRRSDAEEDQEPAAVTAYNFNNGKKVDLALYHFPLEIVEFLRIVETPTYKEAWKKLVQRGWKLPPMTKEGVEQKDSQKMGKRYNTLYEDIFELSSLEGIRHFIRTYFLRLPSKRRRGLPGDPRQHYSLQRELDLVAWSLLELFLQKVVRMDTTRLAQIRALGDGLAIYVRRQGGSGKRFFRSFFTEQNPSSFRVLLIKANIAHVKDGQPSLFDMDTYIEVFEEGYGLMRPDWRLARDLVLMRMIDQLKDWLAQNPEAAPIGEEEGNENGEKARKEGMNQERQEELA